MVGLRTGVLQNPLNPATNRLMRQRSATYEGADLRMRNFRANRFKVDWSITAAARFSGPVAGNVTDVGLTGLRFISPKNYKLRDLLDVEVSNHRDVYFNTTVRVVWKRTLGGGEFNYGVTFEIMPFADMPLLKHALSELLEKRIREKAAIAKFKKNDGSRPMFSAETPDSKAA